MEKKNFEVIRIINGYQRFSELRNLTKERAEKEAKRYNAAKEPNTRYLAVPQR